MLPVRFPDAVKRFAQREFKGESLIWAHKPSSRAAVRGATVLWLFAVPWTAFALFWEATAIHQYLNARKPGWGGLIMMLWGMPFVLIGLGMMSAPYWAWRQAVNSIWVLTDKRLVLLTATRRSVKIRSVLPDDILQIERTEHDDGTGSLTLGYYPTRDSDGDRVERKDTIHGIRDVRAVEGLVRALKASKR